MAREGFRGMMAALAPTFMQGQGTWAQMFLYALGLEMDGVAEWGLEGMQARHPNVADPSAFPYLGRDRGIFRGFAEPDSAYKIRLRKHAGTKLIAGHPWSIVRSVWDYFTGSIVQVATVSDLTGNWYVKDYDGAESIFWKANNFNWQNAPATEWGRFLTIVYLDQAPACTREGLWGAGGAGSTWGDGGLWGTNGITSQAVDIREIIRENMPQGTTCAWIIFEFSGVGSFNPGDVASTDGHWRAWSKGPGTKVPSRTATARYADGTNQALVISES